MRLPIITSFSALALLGAVALAQQGSTMGPYKIVKTARVGGDGGFDYVYADTDGRRLYVPRTGPNPRINVFDLDTLAPQGEIPKTNARGAACDSKYHTGFASSNPVAMWDTRTLKVIKTIAVDGRPDGILDDPFNHRIYVFSHSAPNATVIDAQDGKVLGTIDLGGAPEQAVSDNRGTIYVDLEDKDKVAVVNARTMTKTGEYGLNGQGGGPGGLGIDTRNHVLFVTCHEPQNMVMLDSRTGKFLAALPIAGGTDGGGFNPRTHEAFSSHGNATLTIVKETSPTTFEVEQNLTTMSGAKTMSIDYRTGHVFLIAAEYAAPTTPAQPGQRQRRAMIPDSFSIVVAGK